MRCDAWAGILSWWSSQSPVAHSRGLLNHLNSFHRGMFKLNTKFDAYLMLYSLSHFECDSHTVHMLTQWRRPPPLTSTVKSSLFTHVHPSPLSLAARLHQCCANCSHYINWTFPDRPHIHTCVCVVCPGKVQPLLIWWEQFEWHRCNLAAKESGLECACVNNDDFTVLVSGSSRHHWVSMCTV